MTDYRERAKRYRLKHPLPGSIDNEVSGDIYNVSLTGCKLNARTWIKVNESERQIRIDTGAGEVIVPGKIVRARLIPDRHGSLYELGIRFVEGGPEYRVYARWVEESVVDTVLIND